ncbi:MAG: lipopolysaccharide biosynthesis protein, partial [Pedobacter sp.]|nr:lipopolysaccharide biosynthesis protein [Pedobacter sp.]
SKITLQKQMPLIQIIDRPKFPLERDSVSPLDGIVIGFLSFGFLTMFFLWLKKLYTELKNGLE